MATRSRKDEKLYAQHRKSVHKKTKCIFCDYNNDNTDIILRTTYFNVIRNIFPYSQWDGQGVLDHTMVVPKKHTDTLRDLTTPEAIEYVDLIGNYEARGYSVYSRAKLSTRKTVTHQHTHLIKLDDKSKKVLIYLNKPHIRLTR